MSTFQHQVQSLLENSFIVAWRETTPVKFEGERRIPPVPFVQLTIQWGETFQREGEQLDRVIHLGVFFVGVSFPSNIGMEEGLGLAGRAAEIFNFKRFQRNTIVVNCKKANVYGPARQDDRLCYLCVAADFSAEDSE